jgi:hypothetical protein
MQKKIIPMDDYYIAPDNNSNMTPPSIMKKQEITFACKELYPKNALFTTLIGKAVVVSKQLSCLDIKSIQETCIQLGASLLNESFVDLKSILENDKIELKNLIIISADTCCPLLQEAADISHHNGSKESCITVSKYFISKLIRKQTVVMPFPQRLFTEDIPLEVESLYTLIYQPSLIKGINSEIKGCIFAISGFDDFSSPTRDDIAAALSYGGAYIHICACIFICLYIFMCMCRYDFKYLFVKKTLLCHMEVHIYIYVLV